MAFVNTLSGFAATSPATSAVPTAAPAATPTATQPQPAFFRWREQWCVGIEALDRERRALAAILNHIAVRFGEHGDAANTDQIAAQRHQCAPSALRYWLDALRERAREHFAREEALMRAAHYPDMGEHAGEHALMLAEYTALVRNIVVRREERLRLADLEALKHWLIGHMLDMDKRLGRYLRDNGISTLRPRTLGHA